MQNSAIKYKILSPIQNIFKQVTKNLIILLLASKSYNAFTQNSLKALLKKHNTQSISYISVTNLATKSNVFLLDAREISEYNVSHIKNAIHVGYKTFNLKTVTAQIPNKNQLIIVYCSLGIRSEDIAIQLKNVGYKNIFNLYGGIFEWKNKGFNVYDKNEKITEKIHAYSNLWSKWLKKGIKVYD